MKQKIGVYFHGSHANIESMFQSFLDSKPVLWTHAIDSENELNKQSMGAKYLCAYCSEPVKMDYSDQSSTARIFICLGDNELKSYSAANPCDSGSIETESYNDLMRSFTRCLEPFAHQYNVRIEVENDEIVSGNFFTFGQKSAYDRLSAVPDKHLGHPSDIEDFYHFIFLLYTREDLTGSLLGTFLTEDGWPEELAEKVGYKYASAVSLLRAYEKHFGVR